MKIDMTYKIEGKTLDEYKKNKIYKLVEIQDYIKKKDAYVLKDEYKNKEIEISSKRYIYTVNERDRAIKELDKYIEFIKELNITPDNDIWEIGCKLYILLGTQKNTNKCIKELGYRFIYEQSENKCHHKNKLVECKGGFILSGDILFDLFLNEIYKESKLGEIVYEMYMRNCYKRNKKGSWRSFEVIDYLMDHCDYRL